MVDAEVNVTPSLTVDLPACDFTQCVRALPSHTMLHVPASCLSAHDQCRGPVLERHGPWAR